MICNYSINIQCYFISYWTTECFDVKLWTKSFQIHTDIFRYVCCSLFIFPTTTHTVFFLLLLSEWIQGTKTRYAKIFIINQPMHGLTYFHLFIKISTKNFFIFFRSILSLACLSKLFALRLSIQSLLADDIAPLVDPNYPHSKQVDLVSLCRNIKFLMAW